LYSTLGEVRNTAKFADYLKFIFRKSNVTIENRILNWNQELRLSAKVDNYLQSCSTYFYTVYFMANKFDLI